MEWYYELNGAQNGPVDETYIAQLAANGQIGGSTRVWHAQLADWAPLQSVAPHLVPQHAAPVAQNPYQAPQNYGSTPGAYPNQEPRLPGFAKGWMITDIVFVSFRLIFVLVGVAMLSNLERMGLENLYNAVLIEALAGLVIFLAGLPAAILILNKKSAGIALGWITVAATVVSLLMSLWALNIGSEMNGRGMSGPAQAGQAVGQMVGVLIRAGLLICYCIGLVQAGKFISAQKYQTTRRR
ncbi:MAG: hypothetical protein ACI8UO_005724 [Verrucomicrobiales bacterium]|jgi:hypothetical protein